MELPDRRHVRAIVRRVHPDLFSAHPRERSQNSESLKVLNNYIASLTQGEYVSSTKVTFWLNEGDTLSRVDAELPAYGSLGPLFHAFGLISAEELRSGAGSYISGPSETDFLDWLRSTLAEALKASMQHVSLKKMVRGLRASIEGKFGLAAVQVGSEFAVSTVEQQFQIKALRTLNACLTALTVDAPGKFEGLSIRLYHPNAAPTGLSGPDRQMRSYVAEDGCLHIVADKHGIQDAVASLDLGRAQLLTRLSLFWIQRVRQLAPALKALLGCMDVWCDSRSEESSQSFVLWAGSVLSRRAEFERVLTGRHFAFSLLVHTDKESPMIDFLDASSVLQVRADCEPSELLSFMAGASAAAASEAAQEAAINKAAEEELLDRVQKTLGAKHVISVCSSLDSSKAMRALERLLANAETIRGMVNLSGASIAIDDCYELWESGFVSIPYNFELRDLQPQLQKLLQGATTGSRDSMSSEEFSDSETDYQQDELSAEVDLSGSEWDQARHHIDDLPAMEGLASANTAASLTAEALAGVPRDYPMQSAQAQSRDELESGNWPSQIAESQPGARTAALSPHSRTCRSQPFSTARRRLFTQRHCHLRPILRCVRLSSC